MAEYRVIPEGTVTSPKGFLAAGIYAGLKVFGEEKRDLGLLFSEEPCDAAALFTSNEVKGAHVVLGQQRIQGKKLQAVVVNSGSANTCVGEQGLVDATEMTELAAKKLGVSAGHVIAASTGVIGVELPMALIRQGVEKMELSKEGGHELARAIMTTDTHPKELAIALEIEGKEVTIGGIAKGSGMIHPNMATLLCFLTTDASIEADFLHEALKEAVDASLNMVTVDGDTSPNDTVVIMANGGAGNERLKKGAPGADIFQEALAELCIHLAKEIARDGEGASKLIEVRVEGAESLADARAAALTVAGSALVKTAVYGNDPNWGRIIAALGRSGARVDESQITLYINEFCAMDKGLPVSFYKEAAVQAMNRPEIYIRILLHLGDASATAWSCDLSQEYVTINSAYTT